MPKQHDFSLADIKRAANLSVPVVPVGSDRSRIGNATSGNPNVFHEASDPEPYGRIKSGPAWESGLRAATKPMNLAGSSNARNMRRKRAVTY
jgi:hypothetical protein